jgi:hypothetical protein
MSIGRIFNFDINKKTVSYGDFMGGVGVRSHVQGGVWKALRREFERTIRGDGVFM